MTEARAQIGVIGGSGLYEFFEGPVEEIEIETEYGKPSDKISIGQMFGRQVAFLPRHGKKHSLPPHKVPYQANMAALHQLGVGHIIAPCAVGSLKTEIAPGDFVICDQFVDRTHHRDGTFYEGPAVGHIEMAHPYCPHLRATGIEEGNKLNFKIHPKGTVVVIEGPRFSTTAESMWFSQMGWDVVNMTQYPEVVLAAEKGICYLNISFVTDYDVGIYAKDGIQPVSIEQVMQTFKIGIPKLKQLIAAIISKVPAERGCECEPRAKRAKLG